MFPFVVIKCLFSKYTIVYNEAVVVHDDWSVSQTHGINTFGNSDDRTMCFPAWFNTKHGFLKRGNGKAAIFWLENIGKQYMVNFVVDNGYEWRIIECDSES